MDSVEEDLKRAGVSKFRKTSGRQIMTLCDITEDREQWSELVVSWLVEQGLTSHSTQLRSFRRRERVGSGIYSYKQLDDEDLT